VWRRLVKERPADASVSVARIERKRNRGGSWPQIKNLDANAATYREVRGSYFLNKAALPGHTLLQISRLANPAYQLEVEVIAILPARA
jgi:hypothetical protein